MRVRQSLDLLRTASKVALVLGRFISHLIFEKKGTILYECHLNSLS